MRYMVITRERPFKTAKELIEHILKDENIQIIKVGKNIKEDICNYNLLEIDEPVSVSGDIDHCSFLRSIFPNSF